MKVINLSHAAMIVLAAFLTWAVWDLTGLDPLLAGVRDQPGHVRVGWLSTRPSSPGSSGWTTS